MKPKLIILRGNSGSGKTTTAIRVRNHFQRGQVLLISQDTVRRDMLNVKDRPGNLAIGLIKSMAEFGYTQCEYVIIEGIFKRSTYQCLFEELVHLFHDQVYAYYYDIPFQETIKRHSQRAQSLAFGEAVMKQWWLEKDLLGIKGETLFTKTQTEEEIAAIILNDIV